MERKLGTYLFYLDRKSSAHVPFARDKHAALRDEKPWRLRTCLLASSPSPGVTLLPTLPRSHTTSCTEVATERCTSDSARPACHVTTPLLPGIACTTPHTGGAKKEQMGAHVREPPNLRPWCV